MHKQFAPGRERNTGNHAFANPHARQRPAISIGEKVYVTFEVTNHDCRVVSDRRRGVSSQQRIIAPHIGAVTAQQRNDLAMIDRHVYVVPVSGKSRIGRHLARPEHLPGFRCQRDDAALIAGGIDVLTDDSHRPIHVGKTFQI